MYTGQAASKAENIGPDRDTIKPFMRQRIIRRKNVQRRNRPDGVSHSVNDPDTTDRLQPLRSSEAAARTPGQDHPGRAQDQMRSPRRSAAASRSTVSARSMMGASISSPLRSFR